ncbi:MAG: CorA family divalent cation transporter [Candidatus Izemoplasmatales bacterium]
MKIKDYFTPKSFVYSGKHQNKETIIRHFHYNDSEVIETSDFKMINGYKSYIQVIGLSDIKKIEQVKTIISIDNLVFEDIFNVTQREKIDVFKDYIFSVIHGLFLKDNRYIKEYMSMVCLENIVISFHEIEPWYLEATINALDNYTELRQKSSDFLYYHILDLITDNHIDVFDKLNEVISHFEDVTLNEQILPQEEFYRVRKSFVRLKNNVYYLLEHLERLLIHNHVFMKSEEKEYFDDLIDHLKRLDSQINLSRENLRNLVDVNINNQSNKMNQIMMTLTLFSAIFIPLSFLTGFFGMNFVHFEILSYEHAVWLFVGFCILVIVFMIWFFKKRKWL